MFSCLSILDKSGLIVALAAGLLTQFFPCCAFAIRSFSKVSATPAFPSFPRELQCRNRRSSVDTSVCLSTRSQTIRELDIMPTQNNKMTFMCKEHDERTHKVDLSNRHCLHWKIQSSLKLCHNASNVWCGAIVEE